MVRKLGGRPPTQINTWGRKYNKADRLRMERIAERGKRQNMTSEQRRATYFLEEHAKATLDAIAKGETINHREYALVFLQKIKG